MIFRLLEVQVADGAGSFRWRWLYPAVLTWLIAGVLAGGELVCTGIIGNSGEQGKDLVRFGLKPARGMGVAYDRFGTLWDRAGEGVLNRYALDGRLLGQYKIPSRSSLSDTLTLAGDEIVLLIAEKLYRLPITAKPGSAARPLANLAARHMSRSAWQGKVALADRDGRISLLTVKTGAVRPVVTFEGRINDLEIGPDGTIYVNDNWKLRKIVNGRVVDNWTRAVPGERMQLLNGAWFGHAWHGTIRRFDSDLQPAPGVVLGGASGSFIGHLPQNSELINGRGLALIRENLFAVSGLEGVMHLLKWDARTRKMTIVRRLGALPEINGIGLDRRGRIWAVAGSWSEDARPDSPMRFGVNGPEHPGIGQAVMLADDRMLAPGYLWGKPAFYSGTLDREVNAWRWDKNCKLKRGVVGSVVYRGKQQTFLAVTPQGEAQAFQIGGDGKFRGNLNVRLQPAKPVSGWTSLAMKDNRTLLAAAGGYIIEFGPAGDNWRERRRWRSWSGGTFRGPIYISVDSGRLWVADTAGNRVWCFDAGTGSVLATFGSFGDGRNNLRAPKAITGRDRRAVVFDSGNQRLMKLELK